MNIVFKADSSYFRLAPYPYEVYALAEPGFSDSASKSFTFNPAPDSTLQPGQEAVIRVELGPCAAYWYVYVGN